MESGGLWSCWEGLNVAFLSSKFSLGSTEAWDKERGPRLLQHTTKVLKMSPPRLPVLLLTATSQLLVF